MPLLIVSIKFINAGLPIIFYPLKVSGEIRNRSNYLKMVKLGTHVFAGFHLFKNFLQANKFPFCFFIIF